MSLNKDLEQRMKEVINIFANLLRNTTNLKIDLHFINNLALKDRSLNMKFTFARAIDIQYLPYWLKKENAYYKNVKKDENVYFSFSKSNKLFDIAFLDDADYKAIEKYKEKIFLCIQTSQNKYQIYFKLDKPVKEKDVYKIQKYLLKYFKADIGALSPFQLKRLPGFFNLKYKPQFFVQIKFSNITSKINTDKILKRISEEEKKRVKRHTPPPSLIIRKIVNSNAGLTFTLMICLLLI